ncbi:hypothetical protein AgCh_021167 [Apium graveolens]
MWKVLGDQMTTTPVVTIVLNNANPGPLGVTTFVEGIVLLTVTQNKEVPGKEKINGQGVLKHEDVHREIGNY